MCLFRKCCVREIANRTDRPGQKDIKFCPVTKTNLGCVRYKTKCETCEGTETISKKRRGYILEGDLLYINSVKW